MQKWDNHRRLSLVLVAVAFFLIFARQTNAIDSHEDPGEESIRYVGTPLHRDAKFLIEQLPAQAEMIEKAKNNNSIKFNGETFECIPNSDYRGECEENLANLNNRPDSLRWAAQILSKLNELTNVRQEDQAELAEQKKALEIAKRELQKIEEQKKITETLDKLKASEESKSKTNPGPSAQSPKKSSESAQNTKFLDLKKKIEDELALYGQSTGNLSFNSSIVLMGSESHFGNSIPKPLFDRKESDRIALSANNGKLTSRDWQLDISKFRSLRKELSETTGLSEQDSQTKQKLEEALTSEIDALQKFIAQSRKVGELTMPVPNEPPKEKPQATTPVPNAITALENHLEDLNKMETEIKKDLNAQDRFQGINLEQHYQYNLDQIEAQKRALKEKLAEAKKTATHAAETPAPPPNTIKTETSIADFQPDPPLNSASNVIPQPKPSASDSKSSQSPQNQANNPAQKPSGKASTALGTNTASPKPSQELSSAEEKPATRLSSLDASSQSLHQNLGFSASDSATVAGNNSYKSDPLEKGIDSKRDELSRNTYNGKGRQISSASTDSGYSDERDKLKSANQITGNNSPSSKEKIFAPFTQSKQAELSKYSMADNRGSVSSSNTGKNGTDLSNQDITDPGKTPKGDGNWGNDEFQNEDGLSLRRQAKRGRKNGNYSSSKRRQEEVNTTSVNYVSNSVIYQPPPAPYETKASPKSEGLPNINAENSGKTGRKLSSLGTLQSSAGDPTIESLEKISSEIKTDEKLKLDTESSQEQTSSLLDKVGFAPAVDTINKLLTELLQSETAPKSSDITIKLKEMQDPSKPRKGKVGIERISESAFEPKALKTQDSTENKSGFINQVLAWLGFN